MKTEAIIKKVSEIPAGRFFRVRYISKVKVKAEYEKKGITLFKIVDTTTRTGVKYSSLIDKHNMNEYPATEKTNNWEWVVKDRIKHNTNTGKDYLVIAPIDKGSNTRVEYVLSDNEGSAIRTKEEIVNFVVKSYWDKDKPTIMNITLDNVLLVK